MIQPISMNRYKLKEVCNLINKVRELLSGEPVDSALMAQFVDRMYVSENICLTMWESGRIKDGPDKEPLDSKEEAFFNDLKSHLVKGRYLLTDAQFESLTHSQKFSAARVMARNIPPSGVCLTDHLGLRFPHIYIGIEEDGYAHS